MTTGPKPLRADAERNRRRILDAARRVFAAHGVDVGVGDVARAADVGIGTLYRRFPTKESLVLAVLRDRFEALIAAVGAAAEQPDPWTAFADAMRAVAGVVGCDRGLVTAIQEGDPKLRSAVASERLAVVAALEPVLARAQAAGVVRGDVVVEDLLPLAAIAVRLPTWRLERQPDLWRRYLVVVLDGLRPDGASEIGHAPPDRI